MLAQGLLEALVCSPGDPTSEPEGPHFGGPSSPLWGDGGRRSTPRTPSRPPGRWGSPGYSGMLPEGVWTPQKMTPLSRMVTGPPPECLRDSPDTSQVAWIPCGGPILGGPRDMLLPQRPWDPLPVYGGTRGHGGPRPPDRPAKSRLDTLKLKPLNLKP